jgi:hypothetical protein
MVDISIVPRQDLARQMKYPVIQIENVWSHVQAGYTKGSLNGLKEERHQFTQRSLNVLR